MLLDKSSFCGGNSTKATSGINGAGTKTQKEKGIPDNYEIFFNDTLKGGAKKPEIAKILCANSGADVDWLIDKFDLSLKLAYFMRKTTYSNRKSDIIDPNKNCLFYTCCNLPFYISNI